MTHRTVYVRELLPMHRAFSPLCSEHYRVNKWTFQQHSSPSAHAFPTIQRACVMAAYWCFFGHMDRWKNSVGFWSGDSFVGELLLTRNRPARGLSVRPSCCSVWSSRFSGASWQTKMLRSGSRTLETWQVRPGTCFSFHLVLIQVLCARLSALCGAHRFASGAKHLFTCFKCSTSFKIFGVSNCAALDL